METVSKVPKMIGLQIQKYHRLLAKGLDLNGVHTVALSYNRSVCDACNVPDQEYEDGIEYRYIRPSKLRALTHLKILTVSFFQTLRFFKLNPDSFVICDVLNLSLSLGAVLATRLLRKQIVGIITDFPDMVTNSKKSGGPYWWLINHCTAYVLLTEAMKERVSTKNKKYVVLEGHVDINMKKMVDAAECKPVERCCIYAGGLHEKYGIKKLVEAFQKAKVPNAVLHIYGDGDYAEKLQDLKDPKIYYHGVVTNEEVVAAELQASLLINPRPTAEEFTKYSFPSKNMEYMASGTPVLTTNLPGMPREYLNYVYVFDDESVDGMAKTLIKVLNLPPKVLQDKGHDARQFVLDEKNNVVQAQKIINMMKS